MTIPLDSDSILFVDCQATHRNPQTGQLLEFAWLQNKPKQTIQTARVKPPIAFVLSEKIKALTGIVEIELAAGDSIESIWQRFHQQRTHIGNTTIVAHYSRLEEAYLRHIHQQLERPETFTPAFICTYEIARRLFPGLPAHSLRSVAGFLGSSVLPQRRAEVHVAATQSIWKSCCTQLCSRYNIQTIAELQHWLKYRNTTKNQEKEFPNLTDPAYHVANHARCLLFSR